MTPEERATLERVERLLASTEPEDHRTWPWGAKQRCEAVAEALADVRGLLAEEEEGREPEDVVQELSEPRWTFDCSDNGCYLDTYGYEDIRLLAREHVRETGHEVRATSTSYGVFRPSGGGS